MKVAKLSHQRAFNLVAKIPPGMQLIDAKKQKWEVFVIVKDCSSLNGRFTKSLEQHIDASGKRASVLKALNELYSALLHDDYQAEISNSGVACKVAHTFTFNNGTNKVWELKPNNKDRIYFFPMPGGVAGRKAIFLLMAYHKKDQQTPKEVKDFCESVIKDILEARGNIEIYEEQNVAKK